MANVEMAEVGAHLVERALAASEAEDEAWMRGLEPAG